jgi:O-antigen/teichoic acid export membrane protein
MWSSLFVVILFASTALLAARWSNVSPFMLIASLVILVEPISLGGLMAYAETRPWVMTRAKVYASGARVLWLYLAAHGSLGAVVASFAWPLEACVAAVAPFSRYRWLAFRRPRSSVGSHAITTTLVLRGIKIWPAVVGSVLVLRMDRLLLGMLMTKIDLGIYSAAASLVEQWNSVGTTLALALAPSMVFVARNEYQLRLRAVKLAALLSAIALLAWIGSFFLGRWLFLMIYGPAFEAGVPVMIFATGCTIVSFADAGLSTWLLGSRRYTLVMIKQALTIGIILAVPLLVPKTVLMYAPAIATATALSLFWGAVGTDGIFRRLTRCESASAAIGSRQE